LLARGWDAAPPAELAARLGARDVAAVRDAILARQPPEVAARFDADVAWREYAILRTLIDDPSVLADVDAEPRGWFASLAHAATPPMPAGDACWRPEAPSTVNWLDPALTIQTYVSVNGD